MISLYPVYFVLSVFLISDSVYGGVLECNDNSDCISEATCIDNICECDNGYVFSIDGDRCLKYSIGYGASCEDDAQCSWLMGRYYCNSGSCDCESGYIYVHGRCIEPKGLGETCTTSDQCHVNNDMPSMVCSNEGICICNEGYYIRSDYDCRPAITGENQGCAIDMDCVTEGAVCSTSTNTCVLDSSRTNYIETIAQANTRDVRANEIGITCTVLNDCAAYANSICSPLTSECVCRRGFYYSTTEGCLPEIGFSFGCNSAACSHIIFSTCDEEEGACLCEKHMYHSDNLRSCNRMARGEDLECQNDVSCQLISPDAVCITNIIGTSAVRTCQCPLDSDLDTDTYLCVLRNETSTSCGPEQCLVPGDCTLVNAVCLERECVCNTGYREEDNVCWPNIGTACDSDTAFCDMDNSDCINNVCACIDGYAALDDTTCTPALSLYEECEYDVECSVTDGNSACRSGECGCIDGFTDIEGQCLEMKDYGDYCITATQCHVILGDNVLCRNSMCQCAADMVRTDDGLDCRIRSGANSIPRSLTVFIFVFIILFNVDI